MNETTDREPIDPRQTIWTSDTEQLLQDWRNRAYAAQTGHYLMTSKLKRGHYALGIPAVVLSSLVGTAIFATMENATKANAEGVHFKWAAVVASVSILAAVLTGLQTFLRLAERAGLHATAAAWYSAIRRDIDALLGVPAEMRDPPKEALNTLRKEMNKVAQNSPVLDERLWMSLAQRFGVREPPSTHPL